MHMIAEEIQRARSALRLTVDEVAERAGLPATRIWELVTGGACDVAQLTAHEAAGLIHALGPRPELLRLTATGRQHRVQTWTAGGHDPTRRPRRASRRRLR